MPKRLSGKKINLLERARNTAKQSGKTIDREVAMGLKAIQAMHDLAERVRGSAYELYISENKRER